MADVLIGTAVNFAVGFIASLFRPNQKIEGQEPNFRAPRSSYGVAHPLGFNTIRVGANFVDPRAIEEIYEREEQTSGGGKGGGEPEREEISTFGTAIALLAGGEYTLEQLYLSNKRRFNSGATGTEDDATGQNFLDEYVFFGSGSLTQNAWSVIDSIHQANTDEATQTYRGNCFIGFDRLPLRGEDFPFGDTLPATEAVIKTTTTYDLQDIIDYIHEQAGIPSSQYDTSDLDGIAVSGYLARRDGSSFAEDLIRLGQSYFIFPAKDATGVINWRSLKRPVLEYITIPIADLGCHPAGNSRPYSWTWEDTDPKELPGKAIVSSFDPDLNYETGTTEYFHILGDSENTIEVNTQCVFTDSERETIARTLCQQAWARRYKYSGIFLPPTYLELLSTGDVIVLPLSDGDSVLVQIDSINISAQDPPLVEVQGSSYDPTAFDQTYTVSSVERESTPIADQTLGSPATLSLLDIPKINENDPDTSLYVVSDKSCDLFVSRDSGTTFQFAASLARGITGVCDTTLPDFSPTFTLDGNGGIQYSIDTTSTLTITLDNGSLSTISDAEFQNAVNLAFVGREVSGKLEGELILFRDATSLGGGQYQIDHLIRGWAGTEFNSSGFHTSGEFFLLLRGAGSAIAKLEGQASDLGKTLQFKARLEPFQTLASITAETIAIAGNATKPYAPTDLAISQSGSGDLFFRALPRLWLEAFGFTGPFPDAGAAFGGEKYKLIVTGGRTIEATSFPIIYTAEEQVTDFGSIQSSVSGSLQQLNLNYNTEGFPLNFSGVSPSTEIAAPIINSISGPDASNVIYINGDNFTGTTSVTINGIAASSFTVVDDSNIEAVIADGVTSGDVVVTTPNGTATQFFAFSKKCYWKTLEDADFDYNAIVCENLILNSTVTGNQVNLPTDLSLNLGDSIEIININQDVAISTELDSINLTADDKGKFTYINASPRLWHVCVCNGESLVISLGAFNNLAFGDGFDK